MSGFEKSKIYQLALQGVQIVYQLIKQPKLNRDFSMIDQIKRAVMSIVANIAEGYGRHSNKDKAHFLAIALGSCNEVSAFLDIIQRIYNIDTTKQKDFFNQLGKQIWSYRQKVYNS